MLYLNLDSLSNEYLKSFQAEETENVSITMFDANGDSSSKLTGTRLSKITPEDAKPAEMPKSIKFVSKRPVFLALYSCNKPRHMSVDNEFDNFLTTDLLALTRLVLSYHRYSEVTQFMFSI